MTLLASACLVGSTLAPASAEDFSGFYAGVNAGYAFERGAHRKDGVGPEALGTSGTSAAGPNALPPSARDASRALQVRNRFPAGGIALPR